MRRSSGTLNEPSNAFGAPSLSAADLREIATGNLREALEQLTYWEGYNFTIGFVPQFLGFVLRLDPLLALVVP